MIQMKRITAGVLAVGLLMTACAGCRSSENNGSELSSLEEDSNWADLMATATPEPSPTASAYLPELAGDGDQLGDDVTANYEAAFLGTWVDEQSVDYEFRSSGVLVLTTEATGATENWSYSFRMKGNLPILVMVKDDQEHRYSFTLTSKNLTLYDPDTGTAQALLSKVAETQAAATPTATPTATATPTPEATATPTPTAAPTATPTPTAVPTATPEPAQTAQPEEQTPATEPEETQPETSPEATAAPEEVLTEENRVEEIEFTKDIKKADGVLQNVMGAIVDANLTFDKDDSESFWGILAYYFSASGQTGEIIDSHFTVSEDAVQKAAAEIFADYSQAPEPYDDYCKANEDGTYTMYYGAPDVKEITWYKVDDSSDSYVIQVDKNDAYTVRVNSSGAVISVTPFTAAEE